MANKIDLTLVVQPSDATIQIHSPNGLNPEDPSNDTNGASPTASTFLYNVTGGGANGSAGVTSNGVSTTLNIPTLGTGIVFQLPTYDLRLVTNSLSISGKRIFYYLRCQHFIANFYLHRVVDLHAVRHSRKGDGFFQRRRVCAAGDFSFAMWAMYFLVAT